MDFAILLVLGAGILFSVEKTRRSLLYYSIRQQLKMDAIVKHLQVDWRSQCDPEILELIDKDQLVEAIVAHAKKAGIPNYEARVYVESVSGREL